MANDKSTGRSDTVDVLCWTALILLVTYLPIPLHERLHLSFALALVIAVIVMEVLAFFRWGTGRLSKTSYIVFALLIPASAYCYMRFIQ